MGLPDLEERRETLRRGLGFEDAVPSAVAEAIDAVISSSKANMMTFADYKAVANAAVVRIAKESGAQCEQTVADSLVSSFQLFRPSLGADDLKTYELVYLEFEHKESKNATNGTTSQKLLLK